MVQYNVSHAISYIIITWYIHNILYNAHFSITTISSSLMQSLAHNRYPLSVPNWIKGREISLKCWSTYDNSLKLETERGFDSNSERDVGDAGVRCHLVLFLVRQQGMKWSANNCFPRSISIVMCCLLKNYYE